MTAAKRRRRALPAEATDLALVAAGEPLSGEVMPTTRAAWAKRISRTWSRAAGAVVETGRLLTQAKQALEHGEWLKLVENELPFQARQAQELMHIAAHPVLSNAQRVALLPPAIGTLADLARLPARTVERALDNGTLTPATTRADVKALTRRRRTEEPSRAIQLQRAVSAVTREVRRVQSLARDGATLRALKKTADEETLAVLEWCLAERKKGS